MRMITYAERIAAVKAENARTMPAKVNDEAWQSWLRDAGQRLVQAERQHNRERLEWLRRMAT